MSKFPYVLSFIMLAGSASFADFDLPPVNPNRTVSALDLYGVAPVDDHSVSVSALPKIVKDNSDKVLVPRRPAADLWGNNEVPLRMPDKSEYSVLKSDFTLPEENLTEPKVAAAEDIKSNPVSRNSYVIKSIDKTEPEPKIVERIVEVPVPVEKSVPMPEVAISKPNTIRSAPRIQKRDSDNAPSPIVRAAAKDAIAADTDEFAYNGDVPLSKLSPSELKRAFKKTFTMENKHLSTYQINDGMDNVSTSEEIEGFDSSRDLSENSGGVRPLEIKISFDDDNSSLSRDNYNLLTEYAGIVSSNPKRAVQVSISERGTRSYDGRKLAARRLAIIEQVLKDSGILEKRIVPVLSDRGDDSFVLRVISNDTFQTLSEQKRDMFGDTVSKKTYKSMSW